MRNGYWKKTIAVLAAVSLTAAVPQSLLTAKEFASPAAVWPEETLVGIAVPDELPETVQEQAKAAEAEQAKAQAAAAEQAKAQAAAAEQAKASELAKEEVQGTASDSSDTADETAPAADETAPAVETAPAADETAPAVETVPAADETAPATDEAAAAADEAATAVETAPAADEATPAADETAPAADDPASAADEAAATDENVPAADETASAEEPAAAADEAVPTDASAEEAGTDQAADADLSETAEASEEEPEELLTEEALLDEETAADAGVLGDVGFGQDFSGAYYTLSYTKGDEPQTISLTLLDEGGSQVGSTYSINASQSLNAKSYILSLKNNLFGLSQADMGKTVKLKVTAGEAVKESAGTVTLRMPTISMPAAISCSAVSVADDLNDVGKISGLSFDPGSFGTQRIVQKEDGGSWTDISAKKAMTAEDQGTYRICVRTIFGDLYSNTFKLAVAATGVSVSGTLALDNTLTAVVSSKEGVEPSNLTYEWFYQEGTVVGSEKTYHAQLADAVDAQSMALSVRITDGIGNHFTKVVEMGPVDLSKASLSLFGADDLVYDGTSQIPEDAEVLIGEYAIPESLYELSAAPEKNTVEAGKAWMRVKGEGTYLTGYQDVRYTIGKEEQEIGPDDFVVVFVYDGVAHQPVMKKKIETAGRIKYKNWQMQNADGSWINMEGAPAGGGIYRVDVVVKGKEGNYQQVVIKQMIFTIVGGAPAAVSAPAPAPEDKKPEDRTLTDLDGKSADYEKAVIPTVNGAGETVGHILQIQAKPDKEQDGSDKKDEEGKAVYSGRNLNLTQALVKEAKDKECSSIRLVLDEAAVQVDTAVLEKLEQPVTLRLAPLTSEDLTETEKELLERYPMEGTIYALCILNQKDPQEDITKEIASQEALRVMLLAQRAADPENPEAAEEIPAGTKICFMEEERDSEEPKPVVYTEGTVREKVQEDIFLMRLAAGSGIFGRAANS